MIQPDEADVDGMEKSGGKSDSAAAGTAGLPKALVDMLATWDEDTVAPGPAESPAPAKRAAAAKRAAPKKPVPTAPADDTQLADTEPAETQPADAEPADADPTAAEEAAAKEAPKEAATEEVTAMVEAAPPEPPSVESPRVEAAPVQAAPVEAAPVQAAPVQAAPLGVAPPPQADRSLARDPPPRGAVDLDQGAMRGWAAARVVAWLTAAPADAELRLARTKFVAEFEAGGRSNLELNEWIRTIDAELARRAEPWNGP
jgi:hypothetical protein